MPVPAGIRRPTMTFSFRPRSSSRLPMIAASVSTRVVSWKDAAEMNESVDSDALVMPSSTSAVGRRHLAFGAQRVVGVRAAPSARPARRRCSWCRPGSSICDAAQHLANDHLDVLVVDLHALQAVDVLHLVDDVARQLLHAQQAQDVLRIGRAVDDRLALVDHLAFVHQDVLLLRHQLLVDLAFRVGDLQAHLALGLLAERHRAGHLGQHALVLRRARLEQLGHARQAARDVAGLLAFDRDPRQHFARAPGPGRRGPGSASRPGSRSSPSGRCRGSSPRCRRRRSA